MISCTAPYVYIQDLSASVVLLTDLSARAACLELKFRQHRNFLRTRASFS